MTSQLQDYIKFKNGKKRPKEVGIYPVFGGNGILEYANEYNAENCIIIGRVVKLQLASATLALIDKEYEIIALNADAEVVEKSKKQLAIH